MGLVWVGAFAGGALGVNARAVAVRGVAVAGDGHWSLRRGLAG